MLPQRFRSQEGHTSYDAFGNLLTSLGSVTTPFLYTGQEWDAGVGEYNLRSRFYQPTLGRFGQIDSYRPAVGDVGNANLYLYVGADPTNLLDPAGRLSTGEILSVTTIGGALLGFSAGAAFAIHKGYSVGSLRFWEISLAGGAAGAAIGFGVGFAAIQVGLVGVGAAGSALAPELPQIESEAEALIPDAEALGAEVDSAGTVIQNALSDEEAALAK